MFDFSNLYRLWGAETHDGFPPGLKKMYVFRLGLIKSKLKSKNA